MFISQGWTIDFEEFEEPDIFLPIILFVAALHIMVTALNQITRDDDSKYYDFDGVPGYIIIFFRFGLYIYFSYGCYQTY
jgi:hypothetical protein